MERAAVQGSARRGGGGGGVSGGATVARPRRAAAWPMRCSSAQAWRESGVGKELVARALHFCGPRAKAGFIAINCAAIPENLFEAELFGYQRGAFTGAVNAHAGAFEAADKGTLFLDEIGEMPLAMQAK